MAKRNLTQEISAKLHSQKVAIYIRVSTIHQIDKDSLQVQRRELVAYCEMVLGIYDYEIFEDPGYSAKNTDRPDYIRMMEKLRTGEFSHLLVWKIDRISRNLLDFSTMYQELKKLGVTFVSKNEQFDTSNAIGEAMLKIILVFAELERNMTSERVTAVMLSRASNGQWNGGRVPYGYNYDKKTKAFSINEAEAKLVKKMADMYEQDQSLLFVARSLTDAGHLTKAGKPWTPTAIHTILTNPFYKGSYRYNVHCDGRGNEKRSDEEWVIVEDHHIPILSEIQFDRIGFLLKRNKRGGVQTGETYMRKNIHIFAGIIRCASCGSIMSATLDKRRADGYRPSIYGCSRRRRSKDCQNKYISDLQVGPFVFNYVANIVRSKEEVMSGLPMDKLQERLLNGTSLLGVDHINMEALLSTYDLLKSGKTGLEYQPSLIQKSSNETTSEYEFLLERKRKAETALNRLQSLYLYGDEQLPEKDYIISRKRILDDLEEIDEKLEQFCGQPNDNSVATDEFVTKASYFIMIEKMLGDGFSDFYEYIRNIDPNVPKNFIKSIIESITVEDGRVKTIVFKNGIQHNFFYK